VVDHPAYGGRLGGPSVVGIETYVIGLSPHPPHGDWPYLVSAVKGDVASTVEDPTFRSGWHANQRTTRQIGANQATDVMWSTGVTETYFENPTGTVTVIFSGLVDRSDPVVQSIAESLRWEP
jgi:hypothetical protein